MTLIANVIKIDIKQQSLKRWSARWTDSNSERGEMEVRKPLDDAKSEPTLQDAAQTLHSNEAIARVVAYYSPVFFWGTVLILSLGLLLFSR